MNRGKVKDPSSQLRIQRSDWWNYTRIISFLIFIYSCRNKFNFNFDKSPVNEAQHNLYKTVVITNSWKRGLNDKTVPDCYVALCTVNHVCYRSTATADMSVFTIMLSISKMTSWCGGDAGTLFACCALFTLWKVWLLKCTVSVTLIRRNVFCKGKGSLFLVWVALFSFTTTSWEVCEHLQTSMWQLARHQSNHKEVFSAAPTLLPISPNDCQQPLVNWGVDIILYQLLTGL